MTGTEPGSPPVQYVVHIDGSSRHNPGPAGVGVQFSNPDGSVVRSLGLSIGVRTNNQAEYEALLLALRELSTLGAATAEIRTDSQLLFCQVTGRYRVKNRNLKDLHAEAMALLARLPGVRVAYIPRDENKATDRLARAASAAAADRSDAQA